MASATSSATATATSRSRCRAIDAARPRSRAGRRRGEHRPHAGRRRRARRLARGAASVDVAVTHALFVGDALAGARRRRAPRLEHRQRAAPEQRVAVAPLLAAALQLEGLGLALVGHRGGGLGHRVGVAEVALRRSASGRRPARRPAGCRSGCSGRRCPRREMPSRYLTSARMLLPCAAIEHALARADAPARCSSCQQRQHARHGVLQALGQRHLAARQAGVARVAALAARVAGVQRRRRRVVAAAPDQHLRRRRTRAPSRPCSGPAARRSGARSGASG